MSGQAHGRKRERIVAAEIGDHEEPPIFREYPARWYPEAGAVHSVPKTASLDELAATAHRHPVFRLDPASR